MGTRSLTSAKITVLATGTLNNLLTDGTITASASQPDLNYKPTIRNGVGDNEANRSYQASGTLANGEQATFDLATMAGTDIGAGSGVDALGQAIDFANIAAIIVRNDNAVDAVGDLEVFPASSHGWTPIGTHTVATGGSLQGQGILAKIQMSEGGFDVDVAGHSHRITLRANGGSVDYILYIMARSDDETSSSSSSSESSVSSSSSSSESSVNSSSSISTTGSSSSSSSISVSSSSSSSSSSESSVSSSSSSESSSSVS
jgi:hypothetical protein